MSENAQVSVPLPHVTLMGLRFTRLSISTALELIESMIRSGCPHYLVTANVDFVVQSRQDAELRRAIDSADAVLCDGMPLVFLSRWLRNPLPERVAGSDLALPLMERAAARGFRVYLLGGSEDSNCEAAERLMRLYPNLVVCGNYSPPFAPLEQMDHCEIRRRIQGARADIVLVSFGCPKQEKWMAMNYRAIGAPVMIGVGATIDFLAGRFKRAPQWMRRSGTEWLWRLVNEPKRLAGRYARDMAVFARLAVSEWWRARHQRRLEFPGN